MSSENLEFFFNVCLQVLSKVTCYEGNSSGNCAGEGRFIPQASSVILFAYTQSIQDLIEIFPDLLSLSQCSKVKQAFANILQYQCRPFRRSARVLWSSMLSLSILMILLVLTLIVKAHQETGRSFDTCSITPKKVETIPKTLPDCSNSADNVQKMQMLCIFFSFFVVIDGSIQYTHSPEVVRRQKNGG